MKVTETTNHMDGEKTVRKYSIPFQKGLSKVCFILTPEHDEPISVHIIQSGWSDNGPMFHILVEYGDIMETNYDFGNLNYVCDKWPEFQEIWNAKVFQDIVVSSEDFRTMTNDSELGNQSRKQAMTKANYSN